MINFASLFNQFRGSSNNAVNQLLQQGDVTLSKLLDEDLFINELKAGNTKLLEFMKYDNVKELVNYITVVGPPEDKKRSYKFPLTAAQALSSDLAAIQDFFFPDGKLYNEKITHEERIIEVQIDAESNGQKESTQNQEKLQTESEKQKTIIKDSLESTEQQPGLKAKQTQIISQSQPQLSESPQQKDESKQSKEKYLQLPKPKIKVQKVQQVEKVEKFEVEPLIHHLYKYFDQQINYILTGYVSKVLTSLFNKKGNQMMEFLFTENRIEKMVNHIESRSVGEFLLKVLTFQSGKYSKERAEFFMYLLEKQLSQNNTVYTLSNFSAFVSQTIEKAATNVKSTNAIPEFTNIFFTPQVVTIVTINVMSKHENVSVYNAPILLTYLKNDPFTLPQDQNIIGQFKILLEMFIDKSLEKLNITSRDRSKLGFGRIKIIEILNHILKENLFGSRQVFAQKEKAFDIMFNLCRNFEFNNVLHNEVVKMISLAFSDPTLAQSLLRNDVLLNFLYTEALQDEKIRNKNGSQCMRKGFIGHVVQISRLVQEYASQDNEVAIKILERDEFDKVLTVLVEKQVSEGKKSLGGFSLNRQQKSEIMFQKQDIITHYIDFLSHSPKPVFNSQPQPINIEHPDFLQQMERLIEQNLSIQENSKPSQLNQSQVSVEEGSQTSSETKIFVQINFFKGHLDYNLDDLMNDL